MIGDVNLDEEINVADAVRLQKYLLGQDKIGYNEYLAGDINEDGSADVFDMVLMRQLLIVKWWYEKDKQIYIYIDFFNNSSSMFLN